VIQALFYGKMSGTTKVLETPSPPLTVHLIHQEKAMNHSIPIELSEKDIVRFWSKVDRSGGPEACWPWIGNRSVDGYGLLWVKGKHTRAHRIALVLASGSIPFGMCACHACDSPPCCNPAHLFRGTSFDNMRDMQEKGRSATGDKNGIRKYPERHMSRLHPEAIPRGESRCNSKLKNADIPDIINRWTSGNLCAEIGKDYGVSAYTIWRIVSDKTWLHIPRTCDFQSRQREAKACRAVSGSKGGKR
jgi:hypothetical protein